MDNFILYNYVIRIETLKHLYLGTEIKEKKYVRKTTHGCRLNPTSSYNYVFGIRRALKSESYLESVRSGNFLLSYWNGLWYNWTQRWYCWWIRTQDGRHQMTRCKVVAVCASWHTGQVGVCGLKRWKTQKQNILDIFLHNTSSIFHPAKKYIVIHLFFGETIKKLMQRIRKLSWQKLSQRHRKAV